VTFFKVVFHIFDKVHIGHNAHNGMLNRPTPCSSMTDKKLATFWQQKQSEYLALSYSLIQPHLSYRRRVFPVHCIWCLQPASYRACDGILSSLPAVGWRSLLHLQCAHFHHGKHSDWPKKNECHQKRHFINSRVNHCVSYHNNKEAYYNARWPTFIQSQGVNI